MTDDEIDRLATAIAGKLTEQPSFRRMVREFCLFLVVEAEESKTQDTIASFFRLLDHRGVRLYMDDGGKIMIGKEDKDKMGEDLRALYVIYEEPIKTRLRLLRDRQKMAAKREEEARRLHEARIMIYQERPLTNGQVNT